MTSVQDVREAAAALEAAQMAARAAVEARDRVMREAVAAGASRADVADAAWVSVQFVGRIINRQ